MGVACKDGVGGEVEDPVNDKAGKAGESEALVLMPKHAKLVSRLR